MRPDSTPEIPFGYCQCGCGQRTRLAERNRPDRGWIKGQPLRYVFGHQPRSGSHPKPEPKYSIEDRGYVTPCWIWQGVIYRGYGRMGIKRAHRVYFERLYGPVPDGYELDHLCQVKACVNPDHLEVVTHTVNMRRARDVKMSLESAREVRSLYASGGYTMATLGERYGVLPQTIWLIIHNKQWVDPESEWSDPGRIELRGDTSPAAKLTEEAVRDIRTRYESGEATIPELSFQYAVSQGAIYHIIRRSTWKHVA